MNSKRVCPIFAAGLLFALLLTFASCAVVNPAANDPTITLTSLTETAFESTPATPTTATPTTATPATATPTTATPATATPATATPTTVPSPAPTPTPAPTSYESKTALELLTDAIQRINESAKAYDFTMTTGGPHAEAIYRYQYSTDGDTFAAFHSSVRKELNDGKPTDTTDIYQEYEDPYGYYKDIWSLDSNSWKIIYTYETPTDASARRLRFWASDYPRPKALERSDGIVYNNDGSVSFHVALNDPADFVKYHVGDGLDIPADKRQMAIDGLTDYEEELSFEIDADGFPKHYYYYIRFRVADNTGGGEITSLDRHCTIEFNSFNQPFEIERPAIASCYIPESYNYGEYRFEENGLLYNYKLVDYTPTGSRVLRLENIVYARDFDEETASGVVHIHGELLGLPVVFPIARAHSSGVTERGFILDENVTILYSAWFRPTVNVFVQREQFDKVYYLGQWGYDENGIPRVEPDISD